jgi:hypothetical protein
LFDDLDSAWKERVLGACEGDGLRPSLAQELGISASSIESGMKKLVKTGVAP